MKTNLSTTSSIELLESRRLLAALDPTLPGGYRNVVPQSELTLDANGSLSLRDGGLLLSGRRINSSGVFEDESRSVARLVRFTSAGAPDARFGGDGKVDLELPLARARAAGMVERRDGRIVVLGWAANESPSIRSGRVVLARLNADGSLDRSFGEDGFAISPESVNLAYAETLLQFPDGTLLTGGSNNFIRFTANGSVDRSFANDGIYREVFPYGDRGYMNFSLTSDNKILGAGAYGSAYIIDPNTLDATRLWNPEETAYRSFFAAPNGKVMVVPYGSDTDAPIVKRLNSDGSLDTTFGQQGQIEVAGVDPYFRMHFDKFGRFTLVDVRGNSERNKINLVRFRPDGAMDRTFGVRGRSTITPTRSDFYQRTGAVLGDGRVYVVGSGAGILNLIVRSGKDGGIDPTFAGGRAIATIAPGEIGSIIALRDAGDSRVLAIGNTVSAAGGGDFYLARYLPDGSNDAGFGVNGTTAFDVGQSLDVAEAVAFDGAGRIYVVGKTDDVGCIVRFTRDGTIDASFADGGVFRVQRDLPITLHSIAIDAQGKVVYCGVDSAPYGTLPRSIVGRLNTDGSPDSSFGDGGSLYGVGVLARFSANALTLQPGGRIVLAGEDDGAFFATGLLSNGKLDKKFCYNGVMRLDRDPGDTDFISAIVTLADGRLLATGQGRSGAVALRMTRNGVVDHTLPQNSKGAVNIGGGIYGDLAPDGAGYLMPTYQGAVRFGSDGAIDRTFGKNGYLKFDDQKQQQFLSGSNIATAVRVNGRLHLAGAFTEGNGNGPLFREAAGAIPSAKIELNSVGTLRIFGDDRKDIFSVTLAGEQIRATFNDQSKTFDAADVKRIVVGGAAGDDLISIDAGARHATVSGNGGDDSITTGDGNDIIDGDAGRDVISPGRGSDKFSGGSGDDTISYRSFDVGIRAFFTGYEYIINPVTSGNFEQDVLDGFETLIGTAKADEISSRVGLARQVFAGGGDDRVTMYGSATIFGESGNDILQVDLDYTTSPFSLGTAVVDGGSGDDLMIVQSLRGAVYGRGGNDTFTVSGKQVEVFGGGGRDLATWAGTSRGVRVDLDDISDDGVPGEQLNIHSDIEDLFGSYRNDFLVGSTIDNNISGGDGGSDTLYGRAGNDTLSVDNGYDLSCMIFGEAGDDQIFAANYAADHIDGGFGADFARVDYLPREVRDRLFNVESVEIL